MSPWPASGPLLVCAMSENTPSSGKRSFSSALLSPTSPSSSQLPKPRPTCLLMWILSSMLLPMNMSKLPWLPAVLLLFLLRWKSSRVIEALQSMVLQLKSHLSELKREKAQEQECIATELNDQEQHSRGNNLRVFFSTAEHSKEDTTQMVFDHAKTIGVALTPADINSHIRHSRAGRALLRWRKECGRLWVQLVSGVQAPIHSVAYMFIDCY